ncbi:MAG: outer membrane protein [Alphaproteobacteria bacterium]
MKKVILLTSILALTALSAHAKSPWYVGGEIAYVDQGLDDMQLFEGTTNWTSSYDTIDQLDSKSVGLLAGYKLNNNIRFQGKYNYIISEDKTFADNIIGTNYIKIETEIHKLMGEMFYDYHLMDKLSLYAGAGLGVAYINIPTSVWNSGTWGYNDKSDNDLKFGWELSLGMAYSVSDNIDITLQYSYADFGNFQWENIGDDGSGTATSFSGNADISLSSIALGMRYSF